MLAARRQRLKEGLARLRPVPPEWLDGAARASEPGSVVTGGTDGLSCVPCESWEQLTSHWRRAMKWTDGLDRALACMLASVTSTMSVGDQLWMKIMGPASCGKSTLCEAISVATKFVIAKSTMRGFHSGYDAGDGKDHSLLAKCAGKTLVTKDGDTLLQSPNLGQILSEGRDVYDTVSRTSYRTEASKDYQGLRLTWLLCGTASLRAIDSSELGERFLDCVIMEGIDDDLEDEILWRVAHRAKRNMAIEATADMETQQDPDMTAAMQHTGGYVEYLRTNAADILSRIDMDDDALRLCTRLGKFVAHMRARPSNRQAETAEREFAARLVSQLTRLANCLAAVLNRRTVDDEVMRRVQQVALETSRGITLRICKWLIDQGREGVPLEAITTAMPQSDMETKRMVRFLRAIHVVELFQPARVAGVSQAPKWRLTEKMVNLWQAVYLQ